MQEMRRWNMPAGLSFYRDMDLIIRPILMVPSNFKYPIKVHLQILSHQGCRAQHMNNTGTKFSRWKMFCSWFSSQFSSKIRQVIWWNMENCCHHDTFLLPSWNSQFILRKDVQEILPSSSLEILFFGARAHYITYSPIIGSLSNKVSIFPPHYVWFGCVFCFGQQNGSRCEEFCIWAKSYKVFVIFSLDLLWLP